MRWASGSRSNNDNLLQGWRGRRHRPESIQKMRGNRNAAGERTDAQRDNISRGRTRYLRGR
jgi:hypothetical protein